VNYFATLSFGDTYIVFGKKFEKGGEQAVTKEQYEYLVKLVDVDYRDNGSTYDRVERPRFKFRTVEFTKEEKVLAEIETEDVELGPKKPGRKPKED
jgi:hypothetical protein